MVYTRKEEKTHKNILKKCVRKGDVIHYSSPENINIVKQSSAIQQNDMIEPEADNVSSGESLYKTFTFEQSDNNEETEKCIAFWKSVFEKNLQHIKCAIVKNKHKASISIPEEGSSTEPQVDEKTIEERIKKVHQEYSNAWKKAIKEIQKKKLHEIKLIGKSRCKFCESLTDMAEGSECHSDKKQINKEIKELNNWKSISKKKIEREKTIQEYKEKQMTTWASMSQSQKSSSTNYTYKNVIEEKKQNGTYSAWRENRLICGCGQPGCKCGLNPAVKSFEPPYEEPSKTITVTDTTEDTQPSLPQDQQCEIIVNEPQSIYELPDSDPLVNQEEGNDDDDSDDEDEEEGDFSKQRESEDQEPGNVESAKFLYAASEYSEYTVPSEYTQPSALYEPSEDKDPKQMPRLSFAVRGYDEDDDNLRIRSMPNMKEKKSQDRTGRLFSILKKSDAPIQPYVAEADVVQKSSSSEDSADTDNPSIVGFLDQMKEFKKSISLVIKKCRCKYSDCDCTIQLPPGRVTSEDLSPMPMPPRIDYSMMRKRDSIMVTRERLMNLFSSKETINTDSTVTGDTRDTINTGDTVYISDTINTASTFSQESKNVSNDLAHSIIVNSV